MGGFNYALLQKLRENLTPGFNQQQSPGQSPSPSSGLGAMIGIQNTQQPPPQAQQNQGGGIMSKLGGLMSNPQFLQALAGIALSQGKNGGARGAGFMQQMNLQRQQQLAQQQAQQKADEDRRQFDEQNKLNERRVKVDEDTLGYNKDRIATADAEKKQTDLLSAEKNKQAALDKAEDNLRQSLQLIDPQSPDAEAAAVSEANWFATQGGLDETQRQTLVTRSKNLVKALKARTSNAREYAQGPTIVSPKSGKPVPTRVDKEGAMYLYDGTPVANPQIYQQASDSAIQRAEDEGILDRVAQNLAGSVDAKGNVIRKPDLTSLAKVTSMRSDQRIKLYDKIKKYNPNYDMSTIDRMIAMKQDMEVGKGRQNLQSLDTFLQHASEVTSVAEDLKNTDARLMNKTLNWWRNNMSNSPELKRLETSLEPAQKEFETYLLNNRALYSEDRKIMNVIVSPDSTINEIYAAINQMGKTIKDRYVAQNHSYNRVMGEDIRNPISQEGLAAASRIGIDLGIGTQAGSPKLGEIKKFPNGKVGKWDGKGWILQP